MKSPHALAAAGLIAAAALSGCHSGANSPEAQTAEQAVGIAPTHGKEKTVEVKRDLIVEKETRVIDRTTGEVVSDTKQDTPVTVTQQKEVKTNVDVKVGETATTKTPPAPK